MCVDLLFCEVVVLVVLGGCGFGWLWVVLLLRGCVVWFISFVGVVVWVYACVFVLLLRDVCFVCWLLMVGWFVFDWWVV